MLFRKIRDELIHADVASNKTLYLQVLSITFPFIFVGLRQIFVIYFVRVMLVVNYLSIKVQLNEIQ